MFDAAADTLNDAQGNTGEQQRRSAHADHGQWLSCYRKQVNHDGHVDDGLEGDHHRQANGKKSRKSSRALFDEYRAPE